MLDMETTHRLNKLFGPVVDLIAAVALVTAVYFAVDFFLGLFNA